MTTKKILRSLKKKRGMNNVQLAELFGVSRQQIGSYLKGSEMPLCKMYNGLQKIGFTLKVIKEEEED